MIAELDLGDVLLHERRGRPMAERLESGVRLHGEGSWILRGAESVLDSIEMSLTGVCERFGPKVLLVEFGNTVGRFAVSGLGTIEVVSGKWDEAHFDRMLQDITEIAAALPFSAATSGSLPYDRSIAESRDLLYHAFVYLRYVLSNDAPRETQLQPALREILREPHRRLVRRVELVAADQVRRMDPSDVIRILQRPGHLVPVGTSLTSPLAEAFGGRLPERVGESRPRIDFDTPENQFVKTFLGSIEAVLSGMAKLAGQQTKKTIFWQRIDAEIADLVQALRPIIGHPLWRDVGPMTHLPASSTVLQQRRGYKQVFQHFVRLRLSSRLPVDQDELRDLLELKDIALLYELWCYFQLVDVLRRHKGEPSTASRLKKDDLVLHVPWEYEVAWGTDMRLLYNPRFGPKKKPGRHSYSVGLRPDIALEISEQNVRRLHLFDAKFRVRSLPQLSDESDESESEERRGIFKLADLYKMHTYRDAIGAARSVWVLYPGSETRFHTVSGEQVTDFVSVDTRLQGVGAVPLQPARAAEPVVELLRALTG